MKSQEIWDDYKKKRMKLLQTMTFNKTPERSENYVICLWLDDSEDFSFSLRQCMSKLGPAWGIQVFTTPNTDQQAHFLLDDINNISFTNLAEIGLNEPDRDTLLRNELFWINTRGKTQLFIGADTIILGSNISTFCQYDFIAPLWSPSSRVSLWCQYGNGDLSLRKKSAMLHITRTCNINKRLFQSEGVFFSIMLRLDQDSFCLPTHEIAQRFGVEYQSYPRPFALHQAWRHLDSSELNSILLAA